MPDEPASGESFAIEHERMWAKIWPRVPIVLGAVGSVVLLVGLIAGE